ncbi:MAG: hypothetical protein WBY44_18225 [Bryobacteraceae bacterium]
MKLKCLLLFGLLFTCATAAFSQIALNPTASRFLGQPNLQSGTANPNWVDGREFYYPQGLVLDTSTSPPSIYVADTGNNRVMAWKSASGFTNGQPADLIIGQPDAYSTGPGGGSSTFSTGLNQPVGLAVLNGDLFVTDTGNNRILRYRSPLSHQTGGIVPDLWLGQPSLTSNTANYTGSLSAQGLRLAGSQSYLAFDSQSPPNLWVTDPGNNRVVRFPASSFACSNCGSSGSNGSADTVIGQPNLTSSYTALTNNQASAVIGNQFNVPGGIAFDAAGRLYVTDDGVTGLPGRVLVFTPPFQPGGMSATRIMGVFSPSNPQPTTAQIQETVMASPTGVFFFPDQSVGVTDSQSHRILIFPPYAQWPDPNTSYSPQATAFFGQTSFANRGPNGAATSTTVTPPPSASTVADPTSVFYLQATNELYLTDTLNNRVTVLQVFPNSDTLGNATRVLGQDRFNTGSINLLEGREFEFVTGVSGNQEIADAGIAIDSTGSVPHLYVSDPGNHRILGYKDMRSLKMSAPADIVIGQPDGATSLCNYPTGDRAQPNNSSLCAPKGITVDSNGALYVADSGNGRVLRFPAPFSTPAGQMPQADLVIGQAGFFSSITDPSSQTMSSPYGVAISGTNGLLVSDQAHNRVLYFKFTGNGTFTGGTDNGIAATKVFGQPNFTSIAAGSSSVSFNQPHHIACDSSGQLYVADSGNSRIQIFGDPNSTQTLSAGQGAGLTLPTSGAEGVFVNQTTGEVWVANTRANTAVRYPKYETLLFNQTPLDATPIQPLITINGRLSSVPPLALAQDQYGDLVLADGANRVSVFFPGINYLNGASFAADKPFLAPGMIGTLKPLNASNTFGGATAANSNSTWPTSLGGIQLMLNGTAVPLDYVSPGQINFQVPNGAPISGSVDAQVLQTSTGQVLGAGSIPMQPVATGLFMCDTSNGALRQACVLNQDSSLNSGTNPALRGSIIQIFATGVGYVPGAPPDGTPATGAIPAPASLRVYLGTQGYVDETPLLPGESNGGNFVKYSGLAPGLVGVWQVNVQIPMITAPSTQTILALVLNGNVADPDAFSAYRATVAIK